jgi:hypothetical protein
MSPLTFLSWVLVVFFAGVLFLGLTLVFLEQWVKYQIMKNVDPVDIELMQYLEEWEQQNEQDK